MSMSEMSEKDVLKLNRPRPPPLPPRIPSHQQPVPAPASVPVASSVPATAPSPQSPSLYDPSMYDPSLEGDVPSDAPPAYDAIFTRDASDVRPSLGASDPRTSSSQSLKPVRTSEHSDKRRLLLIFIHGFMGNETSFQSFPAHVHNLAVSLLRDSHTVHTKIYPRYRSKKNIEFARDDFSRWLVPHEAPTTDVILLGHSMGGLVCAEVALSQVQPSARMRHRIVGTINFDVPFLGMHPSVIKSGLASIFSPAPESPSPQVQAQSQSQSSSGASFNPDSGNASTAGPASTPPALPPRRTDSLSNTQQVDPNYNPVFENDVRLPVRTGWRSAWHFINKHNDNLLEATKQLVKSHMEFGSAMADYSGLKTRYCRIRALEEQNVDVRASVMGSSSDPPRVRFVNYYTSSTGRPKKPKSPAVTPGLGEGLSRSTETLPLSTHQSAEELNASILEERVQEPPLSVPDVPLITTVEGDEDDEAEYNIDEANEAINEMDHLDPLPMSDYGGDTSDTESWADAIEDLTVSEAQVPEPKETPPAVPVEEMNTGPSPALTRESTTSLTPAQSVSNSSKLSISTTASLPPIPEAPPRPVEPDFSVYIDKETRKIAEKDYNRSLKTWERAVKDRDRAVRDREKLEEKRQRQLIKEGKKAEQQAEKEAKRKEKEREREASKKDKAKNDSQEQIFELQRRETEREWKEALEMKWNDEDGTVTPSVPSSSSQAAPSIAPSTTAPTLSSVQAAAASAKEKEKEAEKPRKEHTFCSLPPKDSAGNRDPTWVKVFMPDVDEVGAHCGLFFETSPAYEQLVGEVGERISEWVAEAESIRTGIPRE